jgi:hypothetical protein
MSRAGRIAVAVLAGALSAASPAALGEVWRNHFDSDGPSRAPAFFDFEVFGAPGKANWMVVADHNPPSTPNQLTQTVGSRPEGSVAVALRRNVTLQDGRVTASLKKLPARGGLILRVVSEREFLLLLIDTASGESRLTSYRDGKPTELARGKAEIDRDWGNLAVSLEGPVVSATWNEKALFKARDPRPTAGRVGLATDGPGVASFDEFVIETGPAARPGSEAKPAKNGPAPSPERPTGFDESFQGRTAR